LFSLFSHCDVWAAGAITWLAQKGGNSTRSRSPAPVPPTRRKRPLKSTDQRPGLLLSTEAHLEHNLRKQLQRIQVMRL
jgi:hypothetical protein